MSESELLLEHSLMDLRFEILKMNIRYLEKMNVEYGRCHEVEEGGRRVFFDITREQLLIIR